VYEAHELNINLRRGIKTKRRCLYLLLPLAVLRRLLSGTLDAPRRLKRRSLASAAAGLSTITMMTKRMTTKILSWRKKRWWKSLLLQFLGEGGHQ
tara:strand:+ start:77 stop:361 length:285 start_codon:yes stop_codon:yes gene_type:complete